MKILISNLEGITRDDYFLLHISNPIILPQGKKISPPTTQLFRNFFFFTIGKCFQKNNFFRLDYLTSSKLKENTMKRLLQKLLVCGKEFSLLPLKTKFYSDFFGGYSTSGFANQI